MPNIFHQSTSDICKNSERMSYSYSMLNEIYRLTNTDCAVEKILSKIPKK